MCECDNNAVIDMKTPRNVYLTAFYKRSFAYYTVKHRMPIILTNLIDYLARSKGKIVEKYGKDANEELKNVIGEISEFKYEVQTNKPLKYFDSEVPDTLIYNEYIRELVGVEGPPRHFHTIWLLTECYMYRRLRYIFEKTKSLYNFDPFQAQKEDAFKTSLPLIRQMGELILNLVNNQADPTKAEFIALLKLNLWGNKCDLSLSLGKVEENKTLFDTAALDTFILCDHSEKIWPVVTDKTSSDIVDIVLDNSGYEVFTDLCLADYLVSKSLASKIRIYVKAIPWFISDVMTYDLEWTVAQLQQSENESLKELGQRWKQYISDNTWEIIVSNFWTLPYEFTFMAKVDPDLYKKLAEAKLAVFKGDLNYRKLFGERNWDPATSVEDGLQGFHPTKLCILRTIKADIVCGLAEGVAEQIEEKTPKWMETGEYGLIQFSDKIVEID